MSAPELVISAAPYRLSGVVYGTLLNHRSALAALGASVTQPPYLAPPQAPVLYVKPRNTLCASGSAVTVPAEVTELQVGACVGVVIGRSASRLDPADALSAVAGYVIVNDLSIPHQQFYRPSVRLKCHDGFCPVGAFTVAAAVADPDALHVAVEIDGQTVHQFTTRDVLRRVAVLLAEVTDFMTLAPGDILATGVAADAPLVRAGQQATIRVAGLGAIHNHFVAAAS